MNALHHEIWFLTGSQPLYGPDVLDQVASNAQTVAGTLDAALNQTAKAGVRIVFQPVLTTTEEILRLCRAANAAENCIGVITWMHTFSPAKNWIAGLMALQKPLLHFHTQFHEAIPWATIDMDFMNLNQAAHGDREFGHILARLNMRHRIIVGHWRDPDVHADLDTWARAAAAWHDMQTLRIARFGDNMRSVAVTEGDKVAAQSRFGFQVFGYGIGDLAEVVQSVSAADVQHQLVQYADLYDLAEGLQTDGDQRTSLEEAARLELGLRRFLSEGDFKAFTTTFEDLHGLHQLPGLAAQRLMADGYGFGAEGDWKTAALLRAVKVMAHGLPGGTSFMEDYTYHLAPPQSKVLGAHMLEICPSIASARPRLEVHPLGIGGKADPARLVFEAPPGPAVSTALIDLGHRFRLIAHEVDAVASEHAMPRLPVARALWLPRPDFRTGTTAWLMAGGAHHTAFSQAITTEHLTAFADIAGVELVTIDAETRLPAFQQTLRWNALAFQS
jgi:L-arabinose isomerase